MTLAECLAHKYSILLFNIFNALQNHLKVFPTSGPPLQLSTSKHLFTHFFPSTPNPPVMLLAIQTIFCQSYHSLLNTAIRKRCLTNLYAEYKNTFIFYKQNAEVK